MLYRECKTNFAMAESLPIGTFFKWLKLILKTKVKIMCFINLQYNIF